MNHKFHKMNENGRDFIISDLHGCFDLLTDALEEIAFDKEIDRIFSVGDLIDRGPESMKCLELIKESWFFPVLGNHETFLIDTFIKNEDHSLWLMNGGEWFLKEDETKLKNLAILLKNNIPYAITLETIHGNVGICHAQPPSDDWDSVENPTKEEIYKILWGRDWIENINEYNVKGIYKTIHGHSITKTPYQIGNVLFIDTGAFYTNNLTIMHLNKVEEEC